MNTGERIDNKYNHIKYNVNGFDKHNTKLLKKVFDLYYTDFKEAGASFLLSSKNIMDNLDFKEQYFRKVFSKEITSMYVDSSIKSYLYSELIKDNNGLRVSNVDEIKEFVAGVNLSNKIAYSVTSLREAIAKTFFYEVPIYEEETIIISKTKEKYTHMKIVGYTYDPIEKSDIELIIRRGVVGTTSLKRQLEVKYDMQLYRTLNPALATGSIKKFVIKYADDQTKRLARYMLME